MNLVPLACSSWFHLSFWTFWPKSDFFMTLKWKCTTKTETATNRNRTIWLVYWMDTNARGFWLVKQMLRWKNFMPKELCRNQPILRFDVIVQHDWLIEQCLLNIRIFFGRKTKRPCFDLFVHNWLIKQITNPPPPWWTLTETILLGHTKIAVFLFLYIIS